MANSKIASDQVNGHDTAFQIVGAVEDPEVAFHLVRAIVQSGLGPDFGSRFDCHANVLNEMRDQAWKFVVAADDTTEEAAKPIAEACRQAGLSYLWMVGPSNSADFTSERVFQPGLGEEMDHDAYAAASEARGLRDFRDMTFSLTPSVHDRLSSLTDEEWLLDELPAAPTPSSPGMSAGAF